MLNKFILEVEKVAKETGRDIKEVIQEAIDFLEGKKKEAVETGTVTTEPTPAVEPATSDPTPAAEVTASDSSPAAESIPTQPAAVTEHTVEPAA